MNFRGVYPVFQTPFDIHENIDLDALASEIEWLARQGVQGVVFGMVSEVLRLSDLERAAVIREASTVAAAADLPCIASIGAESTRLAIARLDDAMDAGVTAVMAAPPLLGKNDETALHRYFQQLLRHSDVPVVVQDASGYLGQALSIQMQARLFDEFGQKVMFKPEAVPLAPTIDAMKAATAGKAHVFEGMGGAGLIESYPRGLDGTMPGAEVSWAVVALWNALEAGDGEAARRIHEPLAQMISIQTTIDSFVVCEKFLLTAQGVLDLPTARTPLNFKLDPPDRDALARSLDDLRLAVMAT